MQSRALSGYRPTFCQRYDLDLVVRKLSEKLRGIMWDHGSRLGEEESDRSVS